MSIFRFVWKYRFFVVFVFCFHWLALCRAQYEKVIVNGSYQERLLKIKKINI